MNMRTVLGAPFARAALLAGVAVLGLPLVADADRPSYATTTPNAETIHGTIYQITGRYTLTLEDDRGFEDSITLHAGTIITPSGLVLGAGQAATLSGHTDGKTFDADEIDVDPETISTAQPLLPAADYQSTVGYGGDYPAYAFGYGGYGYYADGFANPYGLGSYGGVYAPAYFYGYGAGYHGNGPSYNNPQPAHGTNPESGIPRQPVRVPVQNPPAGYRYPTSLGHAPPSRVAPPSYHSAPAAPTVTRGH